MVGSLDGVELRLNTHILRIVMDTVTSVEKGGKETKSPRTNSHQTHNSTFSELSAMPQIALKL